MNRCTYYDEEFRRIDEAVMPRIEQAGGDDALSKEEADRIYMDVVGGVKKQRIRGTSSYGSSLESDARNSLARSSSSYGPSVDEVVTQRMEAERERLEARFDQRMEERLAAERAEMKAQYAQEREALSQQFAAQMKEFMMTMSQQQSPPSG